MSCCTAATRTAFGLLRRGSKLSLSHTGSAGSSRLPAVARRGRASRVPAAFRNAPAFTSRGGLVSLHRRHAGECPARVNSPRVSRPPFPFPETPARVRPPGIAPNPPASTPTHRADSARFPSHPQRSSRAPAETTRSRAPSRPSPPRRRSVTRRSATPRKRPGLRSRAAATDR